MSIYKTNPLLKRQTHVRLLRILPPSASSQDRISCSFEVFDLNEAPEYQALSYEWGPKTPVKEIEVMGQSTTIRLNLWNFLSRLRDHGYRDFLWCDAICIDQGNDDERSHQVQLMSQIYRNADSVLVWLGEEDQNSSTTLRTMSLMIETFEEETRHISIPWHPSNVVTHLRGENKIEFGTFSELHETLRRGLVLLSERTYWTRVWIVQEITVAQAIKVFCGKEVFEWTDFAMACNFRSERLPFETWANRLWAAHLIDDREQTEERLFLSQKLSESTMYGLFRSNDRWPRSKELFATLSSRYKTSGCEDPRDRIFAILSISREVVLDYPFIVDYNKSMEETFFALMAWGSMGPIRLHARLEFAMLVAEVLELQWGDYQLESWIEAENPRSPLFFQWIKEPLRTNLPCLYALRGEVRFNRNESLDLFKSCSVELQLKLTETKPGSTFSLFCTSLTLKNKNYLVCRLFHDREWTVVARAFRRQPDWLVPDVPGKAPSQDLMENYHIIPTIFEGVRVIGEHGKIPFLQLTNVAQFMELFFEECDGLEENEGDVHVGWRYTRGY